MRQGNESASLTFSHELHPLDREGISRFLLGAMKGLDMEKAHVVGLPMGGVMDVAQNSILCQGICTRGKVAAMRRRQER
jgi:hypothetical protein